MSLVRCISTLPLVFACSLLAASTDARAAPAEPAPTSASPTPSPSAPADASAAPAEPAPVEPAPVEAAPVEPAPVEPAPVEPAPVEPAPEPTPVESAPPSDAEPVDQPAAQPIVTPVPEHKIIYNNITIARVNPLGLFNGVSFGYRKRLLDRPDSKLFRDSFFGISLGPNLSPAIAQFGPLIELQPLAILKLSANYLFTGYFGTFEYFQSFKDPNSNYSDSLQDLRKDAGENYPNYSHQLELKALLQAKFGPVAVRNTVLGYFNSTPIKDPTHTTWYSVKYDILMPKQGWMIGNETDLIYVSKFGLVAGARYNLNHIVKYPGFDGENPNSPQQRLGPLLAYTFYDKPQKRFNKPTLIVLAQWWLTHRYRTGLEVSQALPWIVIAFAFSGELWTSDDTKKKAKKTALRRAPRLPL